MAPATRFAASNDRVYTPGRVDPTAGATAANAAGIVRAGGRDSGAAADRTGGRARPGRPTGDAADRHAGVLVGSGPHRGAGGFSSSVRGPARHNRGGARQSGERVEGAW